MLANRFFCIFFILLQTCGAGQNSSSPDFGPDSDTVKQPAPPLAEIMNLARTHFPDLQWRLHQDSLQVAGEKNKFHSLNTGWLRSACRNQSFCISVLESELYSKRVPIQIPVQKVEVHSFAELVHNIRPNRILYLKTNIMQIGRQGTDHTQRDQELKKLSTAFVDVSGFGTFVSGVPNLSIVGLSEHTKMVHHSGHADILHFMKSDNLVLENLIITHHSPYPCKGGVVTVHASRNVRIENSHLLGSGVVGVQFQNVTRALIKGVRISDNNLSAVQIWESKQVRIVDSVIEKNVTVFDLMQLRDSGVEIQNTRIRNNSGLNTIPPDSNEPDKAILYPGKGRVTIRNSWIEHNEYKHVVFGGKINFVNTIIRNNGLPGD